MIKNSLERVEGLTPNLSLIYGMMMDTRKDLLRAINGLTLEQLDFTPDDKIVESIATLLFHIAGVEYSWFFEDIYGQEMKYEEWKWAFSLRAKDHADRFQISGKDLSYYTDKLANLRTDVFEKLKEMDDKDLERIIEVDGHKHTLEWILYHIFEHELKHIGQIFLLKRLYKLHNA